MQDDHGLLGRGRVFQVFCVASSGQSVSKRACDMVFASVGQGH